jgi:hypothetical protein
MEKFPSLFYYATTIVMGPLWGVRIQPSLPQNLTLKLLWMIWVMGASVIDPEFDVEVVLGQYILPRLYIVTSRFDDVESGVCGRP